MSTPLRLVLVEWIDSHSTPGGWRWLDEMGSDDTMKCRSVGWLLQKGTNLTIVPHISGDGETLRENGRGEITIPMRAVIRITNLQTPKRSRRR